MVLFVDDEEEYLDDKAIKNITKSIPGAVTTNELVDRTEMDPEKRQDFMSMCKTFQRAPTIDDIKKYYQPKINYHEVELDKLKNYQENCEKLARAFWTCLRKSQRKEMRTLVEKHKAKPRKKNAASGLVKSCPVSGCHGRALNIKRHFSQCHRYLTKKDRDTIIEKWKDLKNRTETDLCSKGVKRIDIHLVNVHKLSRKTQEFKRTFHLAPLVERKDVSVEAVKVASGTVNISVRDPLKHFLECFEDYMMTHTPLSRETVSANIRMVKTVLSFGNKDDVDMPSLDGGEVVKIFKKSGSMEPKGFFAEKDGTFTKGNLLKMAHACKVAVKYMCRSHLAEHQVTDKEKREVDDILEVISARYRKGVRSELIRNRQTKARENVTLDTIKNILESDYIQGTIRSAVRCLEDETHRPSTVSDFTILRDVLIAVFVIISMKRLQEFGEFRLSEFLERQRLTKPLSNETDCFAIKVTRHKAAKKGPSIIYLKEEEEKALKAFIKFYRPIVAECTSPDCYVFPNRMAGQGSCCSKMSFANLSRIVTSTTKKAAVNAKITSRVLRRSQISAIWEDSCDPTWREKVAAQCCHTLDTVRKYHDFSDKVEPGRQVIERLNALRENAGTAETSLPTAEEESVSRQLPSDAETSLPTAQEKRASSQQLCDEEEGLDDPEPQESTEHEMQAYEESFDSMSCAASEGSSSAAVSSVSIGTGFPENISVGTLLTVPSTSSTSSFTHEPKSDTAKLYSDVTQVVVKLNKSKDPKHFMVNWAEVLQHLQTKDSTYEGWTKDRLRDKYKYLKKARVTLKRL